MMGRYALPKAALLASIAFSMHVWPRPAEGGSGVQAADNAAHCVKVDASNGTARNICAAPVEFFYCEEGHCTGARYYRNWKMIAPGEEINLSLSSASARVNYGACPGSVMTATHTQTRHYACEDRAQLATAAYAPPSVRECVKPPEASAFSVAHSFQCADGTMRSVQTRVVRGAVLEFRIDEKITARMNLSRLWDAEQNAYLFDPDETSELICGSPASQPIMGWLKAQGSRWLYPDMSRISPGTHRPCGVGIRG